MCQEEDAKQLSDKRRKYDHKRNAGPGNQVPFEKVSMVLKLKPIKLFHLLRYSKFEILCSFIKDGEFSKEVFPYTFCIIIRTIMKLECIQQTNCLWRHLVYTFLSYSDLKCKLNYAIHMKTSRKTVVFNEFLLTLFIIF